MTDTDLKKLTTRYVAVWTESDRKRRRAAVEDLWSPDGVHVLQAPQDMRQAAEHLGFARAALEARGHNELELRVTRAYEEFIAPGTFTFRPQGDAGRLHNVIKFRWQMVSRTDNEVAGTGLEILILDPSGHILSDYQFID
ncbi:hypothetical protein AB0J83_44110 [Actinoplanes sp. NPDC049596]|uniref:hypothetical protein n=1 Tax=unclassified Actinoplanes TaxID=2626549 RepID=UPI0034338801